MPSPSNQDQDQNPNPTSATASHPNNYEHKQPPFSNTLTPSTSLKKSPTEDLHRDREGERERRIAFLKSKNTNLESQIAEAEKKREELRVKFGSLEEEKDPQALLQTHISLLHDYNDIKDIGQGLMGLIAENRGCRIREVYEEFGVGEGMD